MDIKNLYNINFVDNNIIYSLDMLRLKTYIRYSDFSNIEFMINTSLKNKIKKFWIDNKIMCFKYNYVIEVEKGVTVYIGFLHNNEQIHYENLDSVYNFTLEFNPNKIKDNSFLMFLLGFSGNWFIRSFDLALDVRLNILDLITDMSGRSLEKTFNLGFDNKTKYIGKGDGRVKVYNKKIESDLSITGDLTRIEVSREYDDFDIRKVNLFNYDGNFPSIYTAQYIYTFSDYKDKTTLALLYAVQNGFPLKDLTYVYRKKIKTMLEGGYKLRFNSKIVTDLLRKYIYYYFINNDKVHWF